MSTQDPMTKYAKCADTEQLEQAEKLIQEEPDNLSLVEWVAFLHYTNQNFKRAIELFSKLVKVDSKNEGHLYYLANSLYKTSQLAMARMYWRKVISTNPDGKFADKARGLLNQFIADPTAA